MKPAAQRGRPLAHCLPAALLMAIVAAFCHVAAGQNAPLIYRRVLVQQSDLETQISGLLPLKREEFERLKQITPSVSATPFPLARVEEVVLQGRVEQSAIIVAAADLQIVAPSRPALVHLSLGNLLLKSATWPDDGDRAAIIGAAADGSLQLLAEKSGKVHLNCRLPGRASPASTTFEFHLPGAPRQTLQLETPPNMTLLCDAGIVELGEAADSPANSRAWTIEAAGRRNLTVSCQPALSLNEEQSPVIVRESSHYSLLRGTLELESTLVLQSPQRPLGRLDLAIDSALRLTSLVLKTNQGDVPLPFSPGNAAAGKNSLSVPIPPEAADRRVEVQIAATSSWNEADELVLPRLSVAGGRYEQGQLTMVGPPWLRLAPRALSECFQTEVLAAGPGRALDQFTFQLHSAEASIAVNAEPYPAPLRAFCGTQLSIDADQVTAAFIVEAAPLTGERFEFQTLLPREWIVDSVETQPAEMLANRSLSSRDSGQLLQLHLAHAMSESRPVRLIVRAHSRRPPNNETLSSDLFSLPELVDVSTGRRLLSVNVTDPTAQLQLSGDDRLARLDPSQLRPEESRLFQSAPGPLLFEVTDASASLRASLIPAQARYRAEVKIRAHRGSQLAGQTVSIRCQPEGSTVATLLVRVAPPPPSPINWHVSGEESRELAALLIPRGLQAPESTEELYRLTLARPRSALFELLGEWSGDRQSDVVSLVDLPEASEQTNLVEVHSLRGERLSIDAEGAQQLPLPPRTGLPSTLRARFRVGAASQSRIRASTTLPERGTPEAWARRMELASAFAATGRAEHEMALSLECQGATELRLRLPPEALNVRFWDEQSDREVPLPVAPTGEATIPLPTGQARTNVRLRYNSVDQRSSWTPFFEFTAPLPQFNLPIVERTWHVRLAPGLASSAVSWRKLPAQGKVAPVAKPAASVFSGLTDQGNQIRAALIGPALAARTWLAALSTRESENSLDFVAWPALEFDLPAGSHATLWAYSVTSWLGWSLSVAILSLLAAYRLRGRATFIFLIPGLLAAAAITGPAPWSWLCAAGCFGLLCGTMIAIILPRSSREPSSESANPSPTLTGAAASAVIPTLLVALLLTLCTTTRAPGEETEPRAQHYGRVVIPVDDHQAPYGDYVFVDPLLYDALLKAESSSRQPRADYLIARSRFELPPAPRSSGAGASLEGIVAKFDLHTLGQQSLVELSLRRDQIVLTGPALLDGERIALAWTEDGNALIAHVPEPGTHHLEFTFSTLGHQLKTGVVLDLAIPRVASSFVVIPASARAQLETPFASLKDADQANSVERELAIGSVSRLIVRWLTADGEDLLTPIAVEQHRSIGQAPPISPNPLADSPDSATPVIRAVKPLSAPPVATQLIHWSITPRRLAAEIQLQLTSVPSDCFVHRWHLPRGLKLHHVELAQAGSPAQIRWSHKEDQLTLTLLDSPAAEQELLVVAELELQEPDQSIELPDIRLLDATPAGSQLRVYRQPEALVTLDAPSGWTRLEQQAEGKHVAQRGRLVGVLQRAAHHTVNQPTLRITANEPAVAGTILTRVHAVNGDWHSQTLLRLDIAKGVLDQVRLNLPEDWPGEWNIEPADADSREFITESGRQLLIRPIQAAHDKLELSLNATVTSSGNGVHVPDVNLLGLAPIQRFVALGARFQGQRVSWQTSGLKPVEKDSMNWPANWPTGDTDLLEVVAPHFEAVARIHRSPSSAPTVPLLDIRLEILPAQRFVGWAEFLIQPGGATDAKLVLPSGCRLVQLSVDGGPGQALPAGLRTWRVAAPSDSLPYTLSVIFDGALPAVASAASGSLLAAPQLEGIGAKQTVWTVVDRTSGEPQSFQADLSPVSQDEIEIARLDAMLHMLSDSASSQTSDLPLAIVQEARERWRSASRRLLSRLSSPAVATGAPQDVASRLSAAEQALATFEEQHSPRSGDLPDTFADTLAQSAGEDGAPALHLLTGEGVSTIKFRFVSQPPPMVQRPEIWAALAMAASLLICLAYHSSPLHAWLADQAHLVLALAAVAWWILAPFGWLGWVALLVVAGLSLRWPWRRPVWEPGSSISRTVPSRTVPAQVR